MNKRKLEFAFNLGAFNNELGNLILLMRLKKESTCCADDLDIFIKKTENLLEWMDQFIDQLDEIEE